MSRSDRPKRNCRNRTASSQPVSSSASLQRQAQARARARAGARTTASSQPLPLQPTINEEEHVTCPLCAIDVDESGLMCDCCKQWFHYRCLFISDDAFNDLCATTEPWFCDHCKSVRANSVKWGALHGEAAIYKEMQAAYKVICKWKKNVFLLPRGKAATDFIKELTRLVNLFANKTKWERLSFLMIHVFMPIMLQKPSKTSKAKDHARYLATRLERWHAADLHGLMAECNEIQRRLTIQKRETQESNRKAFCRLMLVGKVKQALSFINNDTDVRGVHSPTDEIMQILQENIQKGKMHQQKSFSPSYHHHLNQLHLKISLQSLCKSAVCLCMALEGQPA